MMESLYPIETSARLTTARCRNKKRPSLDGQLLFKPGNVCVCVCVCVCMYIYIHLIDLII